MAACIAGLILFGIGGTSVMTSSQDTIAKVNGAKISAKQFDRVYNQMARQKPEATPQERQQILSQALNEVIREEVFSQEADKYGITVTDHELQIQLASIPAFQKEGKFDPQTYVQVVAQMFGTSPTEFEKNHKKDVAARKLNQLIAFSIHIPDSDLTSALDQRLKSEKDPKKLKEMKQNPEAVKNELRDKQINLVFSDWLNQLNSNLKVNITSERFKKRLSGAS
jgi:hypothetical protein